MNADTITPQQAYDILATVTLTPNEADQIAALIRRQADDLAAIEGAVNRGNLLVGVVCKEEAELKTYWASVEIDSMTSLNGTGPSVADAIRAATKEAANGK